MDSAPVTHQASGVCGRWVTIEKEMNMAEHADEIRRGERFAFGANWSRFNSQLTPERIAYAVESLRDMLGRERLDGLTFLDAGSGSGLFSLAAYRLGAVVHSFDFDPDSTACTRELRRRHAHDDPRWTVAAGGSVLDGRYLSSLGTFDIVYSWGVLHHTGNLALALENIVDPVAPAGTLFIALYNDQGWISAYWSLIKRQYTRRPWLRPLLVVLHAPRLLAAPYVLRALRGRQEGRGMSQWYDMIDWLGGWPFEVCRPETVLEFLASRGFAPRRVVTVGRRLGCNQFVCVRSAQTS
jgi:2-polyprenyl-6-hydroxyphenyl methylase/3-demethylubiquinone-9 3-methyltransferase